MTLYRRPRPESSPPHPITTTAAETPKATATGCQLFKADLMKSIHSLRIHVRKVVLASGYRIPGQGSDLRSDRRDDADIDGKAESRTSPAPRSWISVEMCSTLSALSRRRS